MEGVKKSGKSKKVTSYVKNPQKWPHSHLSLHFVNKEKRYEDLSVAEFCAGYATILEVCSSANRMHRVAHFKELMYLATKYQWKCVLSYHAAVLLEIERGHVNWGDSFQMLQSTTLAGGFLVHNRGSSRGGSSSTASGEGSGSHFFCNNFQRGTCVHPRDHYGMFNGENRLLKHMCAKCWFKNKKVESHPRNSDECPCKD